MNQSSSPYRKAGVNHEAMDKLKRMAITKAKQTTQNFTRFGIQPVEQSRGESAFVWEEKDCYRAFVMEALGTKNLVADETRKITGKTYYDSIAQDTIAMIVNDIIVVGALPQVLNAYFAAPDTAWFADKEKIADLLEGWYQACNTCGIVWGGGETETLQGIITNSAIDLAGSCIGIVQPKERLITGEKLQSMDRILLVQSSGVHANGITLLRSLAQSLPQGYKTPLSDGSMYGEAILVPTILYVPFIKDLFEKNIDIHYMVNITGHGWRKLMRAEQRFSYMIETIPQPQPIFNFIMEQSHSTAYEMYSHYNMGAGFALYTPASQVTKIQKIAKKHHLSVLDAGYITPGKKQLTIKPKDILFGEDELQIR